MNPNDWERRWDLLRVEAQDAHDTAQELADGTADHLKARFHRGQVSMTERLLTRMDEIAGMRAPQA